MSDKILTPARKSKAESERVVALASERAINRSIIGAANVGGNGQSWNYFIAVHPAANRLPVHILSCRRRC